MRRRRRLSKADWLEYQAKLKLARKTSNKIKHELYKAGKLVANTEYKPTKQHIHERITTAAI